MLGILFAALLSLAAMPAQAAPRVPLDEREVLESLPLRPRDPAAAELRELRAALAAAPADPAAAERHFKSALAVGLNDNFLLAAYADFLLEQRRPREVVDMLKEWSRSDTLLLRLALAERDLGLPEAARHARILGERFAAEAQRAERLHLAEEARYLRELRGDASAALAVVGLFLPGAYLARRGWAYRRLMFAGGSAAIALVAAAWMVERIFDVKLL